MIQDQDSYGGTSGTSDSTPVVRLYSSVYGSLAEPEEITAWRARYSCSGVFACGSYSRSLAEIKRYDVDMNQQKEVIGMERRMREEEGMHSNQHVLV